ncbi:hypothetical protein [Sporosarcina sp. ZBG7A]|nr:hypothetical protein [Sporosarcina sp. ZBG7A]
MTRGIGNIEQRIGKKEELIGIRTQFNGVKGLIGSAPLDFCRLSLFVW